MLLISTCYLFLRVVCVHEVYQWTEGVEGDTFGGFIFGERTEVDRRYPQAAGGGDAMIKASWYLYLAFVFYDDALLLKMLV